MRLTGVDLFFWAAGLAENVALLFVLLYRRRARHFPFFTVLITLNVVRTIVLYSVLNLGTKQAYFLSYWSLTLLDTVLELCIVYEVAALVFRPAGAWAADIRRTFFWLMVLSLGIAVGVSWLASPPAPSWMQSFVSKGNLCAEILMSELFVLMLALSVSAGLPWRTHVATIAQGLGTYSLISLLIDVGHGYFGVYRAAPMYILLSHIRMAAYLGCVTYWMFGLWAEAEPMREMPEEMRVSLLALRRWVAYDLNTLRSRKKW